MALLENNAGRRHIPSQLHKLEGVMDIILKWKQIQLHHQGMAFHRQILHETTE